MCDYNSLSRKILSDLKRPIRDITSTTSSPAWRRLCDLSSTGRLRAGHDFTDGTKLDPASLRRGHYLHPGNFVRFLDTMAKRPHLCAWCGHRLPNALIRQHRTFHDHREHIQHHFHAECWIARLVAVAVVFGHLPAAAVQIKTTRKAQPAHDVAPASPLVRTYSRKARRTRFHS